MGAKEKRKGSRYERHVVKLLTEATDESFRRVPASGGFNKHGPQKVAEHAFSGDVVCNNNSFIFSVEAKSQIKFSFTAALKNPDTAAFTLWWKQCVEDARTIGKLPMMFFKPNRLYDFIAIDDAGIIQSGLVSGPEICTVPHFKLNIYDNGLPAPNIFEWHTFIKSIDAGKLFEE